MAMRDASRERRQHVLMRLRQRVDPRRCRWSTLCSAVSSSLAPLMHLHDNRWLATFNYNNHTVFCVWDVGDQEVKTVLRDDHHQVLLWEASHARRCG